MPSRPIAGREGSLLSAAANASRLRRDLTVAGVCRRAAFRFSKQPPAGTGADRSAIGASELRAGKVVSVGTPASLAQVCGPWEAVCTHRDVDVCREASLPVTYQVFCRGCWPIYWRYGAACAGSAAVGVAVAASVVRGLVSRWDAVLRSPSPAVVTWEYLVECASSSRTPSVARLYRVLERREADALLLRHKLGLGAQQGGEVMGLASAEFALLSRRALCKVAAQT